MKLIPDFVSAITNSIAICCMRFIGILLCIALMALTRKSLQIEVCVYDDGSTDDCDVIAAMESETGTWNARNSSVLSNIVVIVAHMDDIVTVSVIVTVLNGSKWVDLCFASIESQTAATESSLQIEVCVYDDGSTDDTAMLLQRWKAKLEPSGMPVKIFGGNSEEPKGVGYGRNYAVKYATGSYLCFQDIDDEMLPARILKQFHAAKSNQDAIVGSKFIRTPENSTCRFTRWANELDHDKLEVQIYTTNGPTIIMPTWFCHRSVFERVGGFSEDGKGTPEDLIFFYKHLDNGGRILRVNDVLLNYVYHEHATTFSISKEIIWKIRLERLIRNVLYSGAWKDRFAIWNAGKQGRRFFRDLPDDLKASVCAFCDVDKNKINSNYEYFDEIKRKVTYTVPIVSYQKVKPPIVVCMKLDLTNGAFEDNLRSLELVEGKDFVIF